MIKRLYDNKQQVMIGKFFNRLGNEFSYENMMSRVVAYILLFCSLPVLLIPEYDFTKDHVVTIMTYALYNFGIYQYNYRYRLYPQQNRKNRKITDILKYHPVDDLQLRIFRMKKTLRISLIMTFTMIALKCGISLHINNSVSAGDILIPLIFALIVPELIQLF